MRDHKQSPEDKVVVSRHSFFTQPSAVTIIQLVTIIVCFFCHNMASNNKDELVNTINKPLLVSLER